MSYDDRGEDYDYLMTLIQSGEKLVFLASTDRLRYYNANSAVKIRHLWERFFLLPMCMYARRQSCLGEMFNRKLMEMSSGGLFRIWKRTFIRHEEQLSGDERGERKVEQLDMAHLMCAFQAWATLNLLATIVFLLEMAAGRMEAFRWMCDPLSY